MWLKMTPEKLDHYRKSNILKNYVVKTLKEKALIAKDKEL